MTLEQIKNEITAKLKEVRESSRDFSGCESFDDLQSLFKKAIGRVALCESAEDIEAVGDLLMAIEELYNDCNSEFLNQQSEIELFSFDFELDEESEYPDEESETEEETEAEEYESEEAYNESDEYDGDYEQPQIKGEKKTLQLDVTPKTATNKDFIWKSQDSSILHVDSDGVAYGVNYGTVIVTVETTDGSEKKDTCKITVIKPVESLVLREEMIKVEEGKDYQLNAIITPSDASIHKIIWTSSDTSVAVVDNTGKVTGVKEGVCKITATAQDGAGAFDTCEVTVTGFICVLR